MLENFKIKKTGIFKKCEDNLIINCILSTIYKN